MLVAGRSLQVLGLLITGAGAVLGFRASTTEGTFVLLWIAGAAVFFLGTRMLQR